MKKFFSAILNLFIVLLIIVSIGAFISGDIIAGIIIMGIGLFLVVRKIKKKKILNRSNSQDSSTFHSKVVGVTYQNDDGSDRQKLLKKCKVGEKLNLIREPVPEDENGVKVCRLNGEQIGWLKRAVAREITSLLYAGGEAEVEITDLTGGDAGQSLGCNIKITKYPA